MKYFPYYFSKGSITAKTLGKYTVTVLHVLLEDGMKPWEEDGGATAEEVCDLNDMKIRRVITGDNSTWIHINEDETALEDFFTYEEIASSDTTLEPGALLWREWRLLIDEKGQLAIKPTELPSEMTSRIVELIS